MTVEGCQLERFVKAKGYVLLAITTNKPRAKIEATPILSLVFICKRETIVMGRQMMMMSVKMLTTSINIRRVWDTARDDRVD
jgi:hypothetical protein